MGVEVQEVEMDQVKVAWWVAPAEGGERKVEAATSLLGALEAVVVAEMVVAGEVDWGAG